MNTWHKHQDCELEVWCECGDCGPSDQGKYRILFAHDEKVLFEPVKILRNEHVTRESRILLTDGLICGEEWLEQRLTL